MNIQLTTLITGLTTMDVHPRIFCAFSLLHPYFAILVFVVAPTFSLRFFFREIKKNELYWKIMLKSDGDLNFKYVPGDSVGMIRGEMVELDFSFELVSHLYNRFNFNTSAL